MLPLLIIEKFTDTLSKPGKINMPNLENWIDTTESKDKLQQQLTGYLVLDKAFASIAARIHLIRGAKTSLDLQYYIWGNDYIGNMMLHELLLAADRGVQVRILIDDHNGRQLDQHFKILIQHPNIQIKLYNTYKFRTLRIFDYIFRAKQINRRMHNKLIIADATIAVTGGRNISCEYFDASESRQFTDMDVLFLGDAITHSNQVFVNFWDHHLSVCVTHFIQPGRAKDLEKFRENFIQVNKKDRLAGKTVEQEQQKLYMQLKYSKIHWGVAHFLADIPEKTLAQAEGLQLIFNQIEEKIGHPKRTIDLISAYFVPKKDGNSLIAKLLEKKVAIRILTNSFASNNVALVHASYQKYRKGLLQNGVRLYEFKPYIQREQRTWYEIASGNVIPPKGKKITSLHAKFLNVDQKVFIGSFNFDPRSVNLNTEVGLLIESEHLNHTISNQLDRDLCEVAFELQLDAQGEIIWLDHQQDGTIIEHKKDPQTTKFQRFIMHCVSFIPIEWMM